MRESAAGVRLALEGVETRVKPSPNSHLLDPESSSRQTQTSNILNHLTSLHTLTTNLTLARSVLREAESWSTLENETLAYLSSGRYRQAAKRLSEASESIHVFQRTPKEFEVRKGLLVSLQNQLEAELDGTLGEMASHAGEAGAGQTRGRGEGRREEDGEGEEKEKMTLEEMYQIFTLIERELEYRAIYFKARRRLIMDTWTSLPSTSPLDLAQSLPQFFTTFLHTLTLESTHMRSIFPDPVISLTTFFQTTFEALEPTLGQRLQEVVDLLAGGERAGEELGALIDAWRATAGFGKNVQGVLDKLFYETQGSVALVASPSGNAPPLTSPGAKSAQRTRSRSNSVSADNKRQSRRFSRSMGAGGLPGGVIANVLAVDTATSPSAVPTLESLIGQWDAVLYEPFLEYQTDYASLEKKFILARLRSKGSSSDVAGKDAGERLLAKGTRVLSLAEDGLDRCLNFTLGFGLVDLLEAVGDVMETCLKESKGLLELPTGSGKGDSLAGKGKTTGIGIDLDELDDLADLDMDIGSAAGSGEISSFKSGLAFLRNCAKLRQRLRDFAGKVDFQVAIVSTGMNLLAQGMPLPADSPLSAVTKGSPILLKQSSLHGLAFVRLLEECDSFANLAVAQAAILDYAKDAQHAAQKAILGSLLVLADGYSALPAWSQPDKVARRGELQVPSFSLSPTDSISHITEGLLDLLRLFESFSSDEGLAFSLETLPFVDVESLNTVAATTLEETRSRPPHHRTMSNAATLAPFMDAPNLSKHHIDPNAHAPFPPEVVISTWVSSTAYTLLNHLTEQVLTEIRPPLTGSGAAQLATDLSYLANAMRALDVESAHLEIWQECCEAKMVGDLRMKLDDEGFVDRTPEAVDIARYVARLRSWNLN